MPFLEYIITLFVCSPKLLRGRIGIRPTGDVDSINMLTPCIIMDMILFAHCHHSFLFIICVLPVGAGYCNNNRAYSPLSTEVPSTEVTFDAVLETNSQLTSQTTDKLHHALAENTGCWIASLSLSHIRPFGSTSRAREMSGGIGRYT